MADEPESGEKVSKVHLESVFFGHLNRVENRLGIIYTLVLNICGLIFF